MRRKTDYLVLFIAATFIHQSLSAIFMSIKRTHPKDDYIKSRSASVYRGLLLSYSPTKKNEICWDLFSSKLPAVSKPATGEGQIGPTFLVTDGETSADQPQHTLFVRRITAVGNVERTSVDEEDLFFNCLGENFPQDEATSEDSTLEYTVSTAFRLGLMYASLQRAQQDKHYMIVIHYIGISPKFVELERAKLEEQYVTTRRTLRALAQAESAKYIRSIEKMDHLSKLSNWQKFLLCHSVISSPVYQKEGLQFPLDLYFLNKNILRYAEISLAFENTDYNDEWKAHCVPCTAIDEAKEMKDIFIVRTYDNKNSIYIFEKEKTLVYLRKYFEHVPMLVNAEDPITDDPLF